MIKRIGFGMALMLAVLSVACEKDGTVTNPAGTGSDQANAVIGATDATPSISVFATGLDSPRGLRWGPDHNLYVAEAGLGGRSLGENCQQVPPPVGPYTGGPTGRISRITPDGVRSTVADGLPSAQTAPQTGEQKEGVADVVWMGHQLYAVLAGGGCSHGNPDQPNAVLKINPDGSWTQVADLSAFYQNNPVEHPEQDDFEPDGNPYSMLSIGANLYVLEANHGELDRVNALTGVIDRVIDISATQGHIVPTASAWHDGAFYVGNLTTLPYTDGTAKVYKIDPQGQNITAVEDNLTAILGLTFDNQGRMYVLETSTGNTPNSPFNPNSGKVIRIDRQGTRDEIATQLNFPTAMTIGPDGNLYVSTCGFSCNEGEGSIMKVSLQLPAGSILPPNTPPPGNQPTSKGSVAQN